MEESKTTKIPRGQTPERKAYMKAWYEANPKRDRSAYRMANLTAIKEKDARYRKANKEKLKEQKRADYIANREQRLARVKAYTEANKAQVLAYHAKHYEANKERIKENVSRYRKANSEAIAHAKIRLRAQKAGNGGSHTLEERIRRFASFANTCFYCGTDGKLTVDHDIPLSRGGTDDITNILPACRSCNSRKNKRTAREFLDFLDANHERVGGVQLPMYQGR